MSNANNTAKPSVRFHVYDFADKWLATRYAKDEIEAITWALSEGLDAWSAADSTAHSRVLRADGFYRATTNV